MRIDFMIMIMVMFLFVVMVVVGSMHVSACESPDSRRSVIYGCRCLRTADQLILESHCPYLEIGARIVHFLEVG